MIKKKLLIIIILIATIASLFSIVAFAEAPNSDEWEELNIVCTNAINDYSFSYNGYSRFSTYTGQYEVRIYNEELSAKAHYLFIEGYEFTQFNEWQATDSYISKKFNTKKSASIIANYVVKNVNLTFIDSITNEVLADFSISYGGSIVPPAPNDYSEQGLIFDKWDGGAFENATRTATIYTVYAPARYVNIIMPDESEVKIAVPKGTTLDEMSKPEFNNKIFKKFRNADGEDLKENTIIDYDMTVYAIYGSKPLPKWAWAVIAGVCVAVLCAIVIPVIVRKIKSKI